MSPTTAEVRERKLSTVLLWAFGLVFYIATLNHVFTNPLSNTIVQVDEHVHLSYAHHLIVTHRFWPDFAQFPMYDVDTLEPRTDIRFNYLNHPPTFYWAAKAIHAFYPAITLVQFRAVSLLFFTTAWFLYIRTAYRLNLSIIGTLIYGLMPFLLYMQLQSGFYNNDAAALLGGMLAVYASIAWFTPSRPRRAFAWMVIGTALASVKLTSFILVGSYVSVALLIGNTARQQLTYRDWCLAVLAGIFMALPFLYLFVLTGSVAPETPGQYELMNHGDGSWSNLPNLGWVHMSHMQFFHWLSTFLLNFGNQLKGSETTGIPLLLILFGFARLTIIICFFRRPLETVMEHISFACFAATAFMLSIHTIFSWERYQHYGWLLDSFVRYYFPLIAAYGIIGASTLQWLSGLRKQKL